MTEKDVIPADHLTILPLIPLLLLDLEHADSIPEFLEPNTPEWLGEGVHELPPKVDELKDNTSSIDTITDEVIASIDVLVVVVEGWILGQGDGGLVVNHQCRHDELLLAKLAKKPS